MDNNELQNRIVNLRKIKYNLMDEKERNKKYVRDLNFYYTDYINNSNLCNVLKIYFNIITETIGFIAFKELWFMKVILSLITFNNIFVAGYDYKKREIKRKQCRIEALEKLGIDIDYLTDIHSFNFDARNDDYKLDKRIEELDDEINALEMCKIMPASAIKCNGNNYTSSKKLVRTRKEVNNYGR